jgi:hypothetical protein
MRRNGVSDNFSRKQMRHKTIRQTDGYTDDVQLPIYESIKNLPRLDDMAGYTQIRAQILGGNGQNGSQSDAASEGLKSEKTLVNKGVCHGLAHTVAGGQMERAKGFEPSTFTLAR